MAVIDLAIDTIFQQRFRSNPSSGAGTFEECVEGDGTIQNGGTSADRFDYLCNNDGGGNFTEDRLYFAFDIGGGGIPADGTITAISLLLYTDNNSQNITDSDYMKSRIVKSTATDATTPNGATTGNAYTIGINNGSDVTIGTGDNTENEFDFGDGDLFDYCVAQHTAGARCAFWHMSKLVFDEILAGDGSATDPSGANRNNFDGDTGANPPVLRVTFTPAPAPPVQDLKVNGGSLKISSGELKLT